MACRLTRERHATQGRLLAMNQEKRAPRRVPRVVASDYAFATVGRVPMPETPLFGEAKSMYGVSRVIGTHSYLFPPG
ncbi:hypothetical protein GCM10009039_16470 [Halocalculus aciditolerans]|uniref:Uncharacterized protein n=1 Tax=Halocalculus aciditolerans TaxID=1383812 RepID=A0A830FIF4_9EURY|nr:hypothetical protein GCM10009039_16470 [Halocalculus aciditolerans]